MTNTKIHDWYTAIEVDDAEDLKLDFALSLERAMEHRSVSKAAFARLTGVSQARISKVLRGDTNLTIESMVALAKALDQKVHIHMASKDVKIRWFEVHATRANQFQSANVTKPYAAHTQPTPAIKFDEELMAL
ncbi:MULTISPECIES: helix-turn-helix domain-containing protein [Achromobacter]|uniref:helix-turn-helix domain-containing protein n=1 Tax=Achromobacter TaxID=222 RepID=UPI000C260012|nr:MULTISPECIES: XRE family transcriptional regulator [Achromobacter]PJM89061.1 hypothetical protein CV044_12090 [Achromobacter ruhlandii]